MTKNNETQITSLQMVEIDHGKFAVEKINGRLMVNATQMAKPFGKKPDDWLRLEQAKDLISALSTVSQISETDLKVVQQGGKNQGTWLHEELALIFAQWLSPEFYILCNRKLREILIGENQPKKLTETASAYPEKTVITVKMGATVNQIYITGGIKYAKFSPIMRYVGYMNGGGGTQYVNRIGRERFIQVECGKQLAWFIDVEGFSELLSMTVLKIDSSVIRDIYRMFGLDNPEMLSYQFTDAEMLDIMKIINKRPFNRQDLIDCLLGKKQGGVL